jgi:hypothetical protein
VLLYDKLLQELGDMGDTYDKFKTDTIARFLVPQSLLLYDTTQDEKMSKLLRIYGRNFDTIKTYIDAIANINTLSYDKKNNIPDTLVKNFAKTLGWDVTTLVSDDDLINKYILNGLLLVLMIIHLLRLILNCGEELLLIAITCLRVRV